MGIYNKLYRSYLESKGFMVHPSLSKEDIITFFISTDLFPKVKVIMDFRDEEDSCNIMFMGFGTVPEHLWSDAVAICNILNLRYRFAKFSLDKADGFRIEMDVRMNNNIKWVELCTDVWKDMSYIFIHCEKDFQSFLS